VTIKAHRRGSLAVIEISDRGCGMTSDQIASIGPHVQFERQTREQQGSGLGLVLARRLTSMHAGLLRVESLPGRGSSAILEFPVYAPRSEPSASPASVTAH
jgi:signal transduction histidine kinase